VGEEDIIEWQNVLDLIMAGRGEAIPCPFCERGTIEVTERGRLTRLECPTCRRFIEGSFRE
jgi:hypothetical protein